MGILRGKKLMIFVKDGEDYKSIAYATNHTLTMSATTVDTSTKDTEDTEGVGSWTDEEVDKFSWSIDTENLVGTDSKGATCEDIMDAFLAGQAVEIKFQLAAAGKVGDEGWTPAEGAFPVLSGKAQITALNVNASNGDNLSYTATFTGKGKLVKE